MSTDARFKMARQPKEIDITTAHQRIRSVVQTRDFLAKLAAGGPDIPSKVRDEARRLHFHYPELWHLSKLNERFPEDWGTVAEVAPESPSSKVD